ncbi:nitrate reductase [Desulfonema ishimotonii]|uniref:Nitrate reductase n=1 Tax=Desulfonema ishimotonii TaxID=45657 RepID=A0A401FZA9_9BACT|nr:nitrate reductase [Desulfonema ishimotonii]GBC62332.1 nitrate reductase [Desulfonema ishimotonii]
MHTLYNFVSGPLAWLAFIIFFGGSIYKIVSMMKLAKKKDTAVYEYWDGYYALRSILRWITPFATVNWRKNPVMTVVTFAFHICLVIAPIFLCAHVLLVKEAFDISWWYLPDGVTDIMALIVIFSCGYFLYRRKTKAEVKFLTSSSDYWLLLMVVAPFATGFWAYHQLFGYNLMFILHMLSGEIMLAAIPFTRLSHMLYAIFTRGYIGSEFGAVRHARDW